MKLLYIEPVFGLSGDMMLSALIDLGFDKTLLENAMKSLLKINVTIEMEDKKDKNFFGKGIKIIFEEKGRRDYRVIKQLVLNAHLSAYVKENSLKTFELLAEAEAKIHNVRKENVHFHELSGVDTIVDIVGYFLALESLGIEEVYISAIPIGKGYISCEHGIMPNPAFATLELLKDFAVYGLNIDKENITPTAAAIIRASAKTTVIPEMVIKRVGYGIGNFKFQDYPNMVRLSIGDTASDYHTDFVYEINFTIDDSSGEIMGYLMEKLIKNGALDVYFTPVFMKKNRPAFNITVLASPLDFRKILEIIFSESTTLGVRYSKTDRVVLKREVMSFDTSLGSVRIKMTTFNGKTRFKPEYEDLTAISEKKGLSINEVTDIIKEEISKKLKNGE